MIEEHTKSDNKSDVFKHLNSKATCLKQLIKLTLNLT